MSSRYKFKCCVWFLIVAGLSSNFAKAQIEPRLLLATTGIHFDGLFSTRKPPVQEEKAPSYTRPQGAAVVPGRISVDQLSVVLKTFGDEKLRVTRDLMLQARPLSDALQVIDSRARTFPNFAHHPSILAIDALQHRLGKNLRPQSPEDILDMITLLKDASRTFHSFVPSGCCEAVYGLTDAVSEEQKLQEQLDSAEQLVITTEQALDADDLIKASDSYNSMLMNVTTEEPFALRQYVEFTKPLQEDLASFSKLAAMHKDPAEPLDKKVHRIEANQAILGASQDKPITAAYLHKCITEDRETLKYSLDNLPPFHTSVSEFSKKYDYGTSSLRDYGSHYDSATKALNQLENDLNAAKDLVEVTMDKDAMQLIRAWYGSATSDSLIARAVGIENAKDNERSLAAYINVISSARKREEAAENDRLARIQEEKQREDRKKQALVDERNNLAGEIWNKILIITMLDDKFNRTEIMGYTMEADKQRSLLHSLLRKDSAMLTPSLWADVRRAYQQVLPGLTVWQAAHAESIIRGLYGSSQ